MASTNLVYSIRDYTERIMRGVSRPVSTGDTWFVDPVNGNCSFPGKTRIAAFALLSTAIAAASEGDTIVCMPGVIVEAAQVAVNVPHITICTACSGDHYFGSDWQLVAHAAFTTAPILKITVPCTIEGLAIGGRFATGATVEVEYDSAGTEDGRGVKFLRCAFTDLAALHGVLLNGAQEITFEHCLFNGFQGTGAGIYIQAGTTDEVWGVLVTDSYFYHNIYGLELKAGDAPEVIILRNNLFVDHTKPIDTNAINTSLILDGNSFGVADEDAVLEVAYAPGAGHSNMTFLNNQAYLQA